VEFVSSRQHGHFIQKKGGGGGVGGLGGGGGGGGGVGGGGGGIEKITSGGKGWVNEKGPELGKE